MTTKLGVCKWRWPIPQKSRPKDPKPWSQFPSRGPPVSYGPPTEAERAQPTTPATKEGPKTKREERPKGSEASLRSQRPEAARSDDTGKERTGTGSRIPQTPLPLFNEEQLRRFHELQARAPMLHPSQGYQGYELAAVQPVRRPLFLEGEERMRSGPQER